MGSVAEAVGHVPNINLRAEWVCRHDVVPLRHWQGHRTLEMTGICSVNERSQTLRRRTLCRAVRPVMTGSLRWYVDHLRPLLVAQ